MNKVFKVNFKDLTGFETGYAAGKKIADSKPYINTAASGFSMKHFCREGERVNFLPFIDTSAIKNFQQCFRDATKIAEIGLGTTNELDTTAATSIGSMFYNCTALKTVNINTANATNMDYLFYGCTALETVGEMDIAKGKDYANMFRNCGALKNITFKAGSIVKSISFQQSPSLTLESAKSIILGLADYQGTQNQLAYTVVFSEQTTALLEAEGNTSPNGNSWLTYIADKGWDI